MKRLTAFLTSFLLLLTISACRQTENFDSSVSNSEIKKTAIDFKAQYIRTGSVADIADYPLLAVISSADELSGYYESNKDKFNLERRENPASDSTIGFLDACDKYDDEFFKKNALVFIVIEEGSGSTRHNVDAVKVDNNGKIYANISSIVPELCTFDMAQWHIIIEIDKKHCPKSFDDIVVYMDDKLITEKDGHTHQPVEEAQTVSDPISGYCGNTLTTVYFDDGKSYTFWGGESVTITDILVNLDYDSGKLCKCLPEYTVDTEFGTGYGINITSGYARSETGQADLTEEQIKKVKEIILWARDKAE